MTRTFLATLYVPVRSAPTGWKAVGTFPVRSVVPADAAGLAAELAQRDHPHDRPAEYRVRVIEYRDDGAAGAMCHLHEAGDLHFGVRVELDGRVAVTPAEAHNTYVAGTDDLDDWQEPGAAPDHARRLAAVAAGRHPEAAAGWAVGTRGAWGLYDTRDRVWLAAEGEAAPRTFGRVTAAQAAARLVDARLGHPVGRTAVRPYAGAGRVRACEYLAGITRMACKAGAARGQ